MANDFNKTANEFFKSPAGAKLSGKKDEINQLINSPEGRTVKNMIDKDQAAIMTALENGDMAVLQKALTNILKTEDGSKIAEQVIKLMN